MTEEEKKRLIDIAIYDEEVRRDRAEDDCPDAGPDDLTAEDIARIRLRAHEAYLKHYQEWKKSLGPS